MKRKSLEGWVSRILPLDVTFEGLTQDDVDAALINHHPIPLLFGLISADSVLIDLRQRGIDARLLERGYSDLRVEIPSLPVNQEGLQLTAAHDDAPERVRLMELKAFWGRLPLPTHDDVDPAACRALVWDWLELRDPMGQFEPSRGPLPGQTAPGLSMFSDLVQLTRTYVGRTDAEALVTIPLYFHNAVLYERAPGLRYRFLDPLRQGQLEAQMRDLLSQTDLHGASWAFSEDRVEMLAPGADQATGWTGCPWTPSELVLPLTERVKEVLDREDPLVEHGLAHKFRLRATPHPDIEGSFHLGSGPE